MEGPEGARLPGTFVGVQAAERSMLGAYAARALHRHEPHQEMSPLTAAVLRGVILGAAEQVNGQKLTMAFNGKGRDELTMLELAMAFRREDTGLYGDVFEWSVMHALNYGDNDITQLIADGLLLAGRRFANPRACLVAAEAGRLVTYSPGLPLNASLATGRRGRPPLLSNVLDGVTTRTWKADLVIGEDGAPWVPATLKSNALDLSRSLQASARAGHDLIIGIAPTRPADAGVRRERHTGLPMVFLPADANFLELSHYLLRAVSDAFERHLTLPSNPVQQDSTAVQLNHWTNRTVREVAEILHRRASIYGAQLLQLSPVADAGADAEHLPSALVQVDGLVPTVDARHRPVAYTRRREGLQLRYSLLE